MGRLEDMASRVAGTSCRTRNEDMPQNFEAPALVPLGWDGWPEAGKTASAASARALMRPYEGLPLECDGMARVATYVLGKAGIPHRVMQGRIEVQGKGDFEPHWWVELQSGEVVDYRSRMWFGNDPGIPQGVFRPAGTVVSYVGRPVRMPVSDVVFQMLTASDVP